MQPIVEPVFLVEPEFDLFNPKTVTSPMWRSWYFLLVLSDSFTTKIKAIKYFFKLVQNLSLNEIKRLARVMTLKNSAACLPYGGGKSGLILNEQISNIEPNLKKDLMSRFAEALFDLKNYVPAADMGTDENDIQVIYEHHTKSNPNGLTKIPLEFR